MIKVKKLDGTPVKVGAFALHDFDGKEILQRPFFRDLKLNAGTDEKVLQDVWHNSLGEKREEKLRAILKKLREYQRRMVEHIDVLSETYLKLAGKFADLQTNEDTNGTTAKAIEKLKSQLRHAKNLQAGYTLIYNSEILKLSNFVSERVAYAAKETEILKRKEFGNRLRQARKSKGLSVRALAEIVGVSHADVSNYELGVKSPAFKNLLKLVETLEISADWLLFGK